MERTIQRSDAREQAYSERWNGGYGNSLTPFKLPDESPSLHEWRLHHVRRVRIKIIPLVSRKAGVSGKLYLRDISDMTGRKLHCTELLDLGKEIRLSMQHLDFSVSTRSDVPIVFGFEDLVSPFLEGRELFSVSLRWQFGLSTQCYSLPPAKWKVSYQEDALKVLKPSKNKANRQTLQSGVTDAKN